MNLVFSVMNAFMELEINAFKHGPWKTKCDCVCVWTPRCVVFEDGGIALILIRFHDNIKIICSHWRVFGSYLIFSSHESVHGSGDIRGRKNEVRSCVFWGFFWEFRAVRPFRIIFFGGGFLGPPGRACGRLSSYSNLEDVHVYFLFWLLLCWSGQYRRFFHKKYELFIYFVLTESENLNTFLSRK